MHLRLQGSRIVGGIRMHVIVKVKIVGGVIHFKSKCKALLSAVENWGIHLAGVTPECPTFGGKDDWVLIATFGAC